MSKKDSKNEIFVPRSIGNKRVKAKVDALCQLIEENKSNPFYVCTHDNPDPDAMGSAFGMMRILEFLGVENVTGWYRGEIDHPQNIAMLNALSVPIKPWSKKVEKEVPENACFIFVDCAGKQKNMTIPFGPIIAVDHHKNVADKDVLFIHDEIGSCAALITDLMLLIPARTIGDTEFVCFDIDLDNMREIATALAIGIKTDTRDFVNETTSSYDCAAQIILSKVMSDDKYHKIVDYSLPPYIFESERTAWENKHQEGPNLVTGLGYLEDSRSGCIPHNADHLMRLSGIQTVMVFGVVGNSVRASIRSTSAAIDAGTLCEDIFGEGAGGSKSGGIAGAKVHYNVFEPGCLTVEDKQKLWELTRSTIEQKFKQATQK